MYFRVFKFTVILSIFQCLFILKKKNWNAALYDVIDDVRALVPGLVIGSLADTQKKEKSTSNL